MNGSGGAKWVGVSVTDLERSMAFYQSVGFDTVVIHPHDRFSGNIDDINFDSIDKTYGFGVSRYEIAGRPQEDSEQPFFGSGDITEQLILEFRQ